MDEKTTSSESAKPKCFVIMPISSQPGYAPEHFTLVYEDIIKPAIEQAGMEPLRADETINTNLIQLDILRKVIESDIAICDMSAKNPNVFYELGVRQAFDKPTVLMTDEITAAPFDVSSLRYVTYSQEMKYREVNKAINDLSMALTDTYTKRNDSSEINSLIKLMELVTPAKINQSELTPEEKLKLINEIQYAELIMEIQSIRKEQSVILNEVLKTRSEDTKVRWSDIKKYNFQHENKATDILNEKLRDIQSTSSITISDVPKI